MSFSEVRRASESAVREVLRLVRKIAKIYYYRTFWNLILTLLIVSEGKSQMRIRIACGLDSRGRELDFGKMIEPLYVS